MGIASWLTLLNPLLLMHSHLSTSTLLSTMEINPQRSSWEQVHRCPLTGFEFKMFRPTYISLFVVYSFLSYLHLPIVRFFSAHNLSLLLLWFHSHILTSQIALSSLKTTIFTVQAKRSLGEWLCLSLVYHLTFIPIERSRFQTFYTENSNCVRKIPSEARWMINPTRNCFKIGCDCALLCLEGRHLCFSIHTIFLYPFSAIHIPFLHQYF